MPEMLLVKSMTWSPLVHVLILAFGTLLSFLIALSRGDVNLYLPFISETGAYSPEMCVFSLFLILGSFVGFIVIGIRFLLISQYEEDQFFTRINYASLGIGMVAMLGLAGVAAFPMTTVFWAHLIAASMYFCGSASYFICSTIMTWRTEKRSKTFILRCILTAFLLVLLFMLMVCFPIALIRWHEFNSIIPALKEPTNKGFGMILLCSLLEWNIVIVIIIFTLTFIPEMRNHGLLLTVTPIKSESDSVVQDCPRVTESPT